MSIELWEPIVDQSALKIGTLVQAYKAKETNMIAYYIRNREDMLLLTPNDFIGIYQSLKNNYGVYFLLGDETSSGRKTVYVGRASQRTNAKGIDRLKEHLDKNKPDKYINRWKSVLFVTSTNNDWSTGVLDTLESVFISIFKKDTHYDCLNKPHCVNVV